METAAEKFATDNIGGYIAASWFVEGAKWAEKRLTPTREQLAEAVATGLDGMDDFQQWSPDYQREMLEAADAILELMGKLAEGESE